MTIATGYCTNVHAGPDLARTRANLERHTLEVKRLVSPDRPMGVGLWLAARCGAQPAPQLQSRAEVRRVAPRGRTCAVYVQRLSLRRLSRAGRQAPRLRADLGRFEATRLHARSRRDPGRPVAARNGRQHLYDADRLGPRADRSPAPRRCGSACTALAGRSQLAWKPNGAGRSTFASNRSPAASCTEPTTSSASSTRISEPIRPCAGICASVTTSATRR